MSKKQMAPRGIAAAKRCHNNKKLKMQETENAEMSSPLFLTEDTTYILWGREGSRRNTCGEGWGAEMGGSTQPTPKKWARASIRVMMLHCSHLCTISSTENRTSSTGGQQKGGRNHHKLPLTRRRTKFYNTLANFISTQHTQRGKKNRNMNENSQTGLYFSGVLLEVMPMIGEAVVQYFGMHATQRTLVCVPSTDLEMAGHGISFH
eukprot:RCo034100